MDYRTVSIRSDHINTINIIKNPIQHPRAKHNEVRHHFIRDHVEKADIFVDDVPDLQLFDIFTRLLGQKQLCLTGRELRFINQNACIEVEKFLSMLMRLEQLQRWAREQ